MKKTIKLFNLLLLWAYCLISPLNAQAAQIHLTPTIFTIEEWKDEYLLKNAVGIIPDKGLEIGIKNVEEQLQDISFIALNQINANLEAHQYYWGKIQLKNSLPDATNFSEWILDFSSTITEIDLYIQQPNGTYQKQLNGEFRPFAVKPFSPILKRNLVRVTLPPEQAIQIYFRAKSGMTRVAPNFEIKLQHTTAFADSLRKGQIRHYFFLGFLGMMLLYNLLGAVLKRDRSFIYHSLYLSTLIIYSSNVTYDIINWTGPYFYPNHPEYSYLFNLSVIISYMAYIGFLRSFLNLQELMPKWDRFYAVYFWMGVPFTLVYLGVIIQFDFSFGIADYIPSIYALLFFVPTFIFIYQLYQTKDKKGRFVVAGMVILLLGTFGSFLQWAEVISLSVMDMKIAFVLEVLCFSAGLVYREQENVKAKEQANYQLEKTKLVQVQEQAELEQLKNLDQLKSRLYTNITHEFRTPLTVIMGMNQNIKGHANETDLIRRNSKNLLRLINQLLDLSKVESSTLKVHKTNGNIVAYLQYLTESFYSMATDKGIRLTFYSEIEALEMDYDETKVQHVIYNLLSNAIKFTEADGKVIFHLQQIMRAEQPFLKIKIQDTGIGIPAEVLPHIFDRFYQVDNSSTRKGEGTGIGLALVKELIELMDGQIEVQSKVEKGTEFLLYFPIEGSIPLSSNLSETFISQNKPKEQTSLSESSQLEKQAPPANLPILLIIEDNSDVVQYIQSILEKEYFIHTAKNGQIGIEKAIELIPDIIISDVMMPLKNGYEVCETLKSDERTNHIPIILLTAKATQEDKIAGLQYGADAFITKPFHQEELLIRLEKLTALRKALQNRYVQQNTLATPASNLEEVSPFLQKLKTLILEQLDNPDFSVADLGKAVQMSDMQVYRKLKALTDQTPSRLIRAVRLEKGQQLLKETDLTIAEIAYAVGFSTPNYFSRTFHSEFGCPPSDYRQL